MHPEQTIFKEQKYNFSHITILFLNNKFDQICFFYQLENYKSGFFHIFRLSIISSTVLAMSFTIVLAIVIWCQKSKFGKRFFFPYHVKYKNYNPLSCLMFISGRIRKRRRRIRRSIMEEAENEQELGLVYYKN